MKNVKLSELERPENQAILANLSFEIGNKIKLEDYQKMNQAIKSIYDIIENSEISEYEKNVYLICVANTIKSKIL